MSRISDIVTQIRTAVYGRDVRTNIADGIEICYSNVQEGKTLAETAAEQAESRTTAAVNNANVAANNANTKATAAQTAANNANSAAQRAEETIAYAVKIDEHLNYKTSTVDYGTLTNLNNATPNTYYCINMSNNAKTEIAHIPDSVPLDGYNWYTVMFNYYSDAAHSASKIQYFYNNDLSIIYRRQYESNTWYSWSKVISGTMSSENNANVRAGDLVIGSLTNLNNAKDNTQYLIQLTSEHYNEIQNLPDPSVANGYNWYLMTYKCAKSNNAASKIQYFYNDDLSVIYRRQYESNTWYSWSKITKSLVVDDTANVRVGEFPIIGSLTNLNNARDNTHYTLQLTSEHYSEIQNLPDPSVADGYTWYLMTFTCNKYSGASKIQYFYNNDLSVIYRRQYDIVSQSDPGSWYSWSKIKGNETSERYTIVIDKNGGGDYTSFVSGISAAYSQGNTDIYIRNGVYDITQEIDLENAGSGPKIGKGMRLYFDSDAVIQCYYTGTSDTVKSQFAPLNAGNDSGFEIYNMKIRCKNTRYCVHDEHGDGTTPYKNKYINCDMYLDNSDSIWDSPQCIGGGLGKNGIIEIDGGYYEGTVHQGDNTYGEISYHNSIANDAKSEIHIKNVYCKNNTVRFGYYGSSTKITKCFVSGCSFAATPLVRPEVSGGTNVNMEMKAWNNEIRS